MQKYVPGQRWISEAEPDLGLGLVIEAGDRRVRVAFLAADEDRSYAETSAPLSRVIFRDGELARHGDGWRFRISASLTQDGLIIYKGEREDNGDIVAVMETQLAHDMRVNQPQDRLFTNQFDKQREFELRYETLRQRAKLEQSPVRGLLGARVDIIAHQLFIANEVASRPSPRVLLADEVGLGKTVEAGLIIHHQLMTERAGRVLIVVPKALISQWLLELMRRFNLSAAVFDEQRCDEAELASGNNPFLTEQIIVCSLDFLTANAERAQQATMAEWDLLVVDEAHHLHWAEHEASPEYRLIEALAGVTPGLLLLTATPEQLGIESHFARLRLLDPQRFNDLDAFVDEQQGYEAAADAVSSLLNNKALTAAQHHHLVQLDSNTPSLEALQQPALREQLVHELCDRHGTGRVLFRNTRAHIKGFPARVLHSYALDDDIAQVDWLIHWLKSHKEKVLLICASKTRAIALEERLHMREGILCASFHEDLGLLARDRAAAWFAEDVGAQVLLCSEIGSEGRNFQFARHLVLLDLPANPDLLEQRIGRLDRIGQQHDIQIHVPYVRGGREEVLFRWYHEGLNAFEKNCKSAAALYERFGAQLQQLTADDAQLEQFIATTAASAAQLNERLEKGRDKLLELSSFNDAKAVAISTAFAAASEDYAELASYFEQLCDNFGIDIDEHSAHSWVLQQGSHYKGGFKDLSEEGTTVTFDRRTALANEDYKYLTWEHPLVTDGIDQIIGSYEGNATIGTIKLAGIPAGLMMVECLFTANVIAAKGLQVGRYMPPQLLRVVVDAQQRSIGKAIPFSALKGAVKKVNRGVAKQIVEGQKAEIEAMIARAQQLAEAALPKLQAKACDKQRELLLPEVERITYLREVNPSVRAEEVAAIKQQYEGVSAAIAAANVNLDAVRVLVSVH